MREPTNSEADTWIIGFPTRPICKRSCRKRPNRPHISSDISQCQKAKATKQPKPRQTFDAAQAIKSPEF
ncbi:hypothetical protein, partial [Paracoccus shanxieyensis]|uniref:hypothetical protein n=1 Tax=Paracoccus shanxieyensis TaxID=2675752 RepID=UPI001E4AB7A3